MKKFIFKLELIHLLPLIAIVLIVLSFIIPSQTAIQIQLSITFVLLYLTFSIIHHFLDKSLTLEVILDYILIAALVLIILSGTALY